MRRAALLWTAALAGLGALALWPAPATQAPPAAAIRPTATPVAAQAPTSRVLAESAPVAAPAAVGAPAPSLLRPGLRDRLEAWLLAAGPAPDPAALKDRLAATVGQHFAPDEAAAALALARRYVDYRVALGQLSPPADPSDPYALRQALQARQRVRQLHFAADEYQTLFGAEEALDRLTVARADILRNPQLTARQRADALAAVEQQLPPEERALRTAALAPQSVGEQTAAFNAQGVDAVTRQQLRATQYGQAASERLATLDAEDAQWQARLASYAAARERQANAGELAQLRATLFTPEESLRVDAALRLRALGTPVR